MAVGDLRRSYAEGTTENACILLRCEGGEVTAVIAYARAQVWGQEPSKFVLGHVVDGKESGGAVCQTPGTVAMAGWPRQGAPLYPKTPHARGWDKIGQNESKNLLPFRDPVYITKLVLKVLRKGLRPKGPAPGPDTDRYTGTYSWDLTVDCKLLGNYIPEKSCGWEN